MAQLLVSYKTPKDPADSDIYYAETHVPIAKKLLGPRTYQVSQVAVVSPWSVRLASGRHPGSQAAAAASTGAHSRNGKRRAALDLSPSMAPHKLSVYNGGQ
jgi:uncharacterized protein (TIGR02118 family)